MTVEPGKVGEGGAVVPNPPAAPPAEPAKGRSPNEDDLKALLKNREEKLAVEQAEKAALAARLQDLEQRVMGRYQNADPLTASFQTLTNDAQFGDERAQATLEVGKLAARAELNTNLTKAMVKAKVSAEDWDEVEGLIVQSGYRMTVEQAKERAKSVTTKVVSERDKLQKELEQTKKELENERTRVRVPNMALMPAAVPVEGGSVPKSTYDAVVRAGGEAARKLKARVNSSKDAEGHLDIDWGQ